MRNDTLGRSSTRSERQFLQTTYNDIKPNLTKPFPVKIKRVNSMKLFYFDLHGRAMQTRMILDYCGVEYEDIRVSPEQFGEMKEKGQLTYG